jgi:hypothetical protein
MDKVCLLIYFVILDSTHLLQCDTLSHTPQEKNMQPAEIMRTGCRGEYFELGGTGGSRSCKDCVIKKVIIVSLSQTLLRDRTGDEI